MLEDRHPSASFMRAQLFKLQHAVFCCLPLTEKFSFLVSVNTSGFITDWVPYWNQHDNTSLCFSVIRKPDHTGRPSQLRVTLRKNFQNAQVFVNQWKLAVYAGLICCVPRYFLPCLHCVNSNWIKNNFVCNYGRVPFDSANAEVTRYSYHTPLGFDWSEKNYVS